MQGTVKFYNFAKGYGFITQDGGDDLFFHISGVTKIDDGENERHSFVPEEGDMVTYEIEDTERGTKAVNINKVEGGMAEEAPAEAEAPAADEAMDDAE